MSNWNFDTLPGVWIGGHVTNNNGINCGKPCNKDRTIQVTNDNGREIYKEEVKLKKFKNKKERNTYIEKRKRELCKKYDRLKNRYRPVKYKGIECFQVELNNGKSMLISKKNIQDISQFVWISNGNSVARNCNAKEKKEMKNKGEKVKQKEYISKRILGNKNNPIANFKDKNPFNLLRENIEDSGKERSIVTDDQLKKNNLIALKYLKFLEHERKKYGKLYNKEDGSFIFDKILSGWQGGHINSYYNTRRTRFELYVKDYNNNLLKTRHYHFNKNNKDDVKTRMEKHLNIYLKRHRNLLVLNDYRYVIFNGHKCIEMSLTENKTCIFDKDNLDIIKNYKWRFLNNGTNITKHFVAVTYMGSHEILYMHRILTNNQWNIVDHIDGCSLNNLNNNLKSGDNNYNNYNRKLQSNNTTGINGISWDSTQERYRFRWQDDDKVEHMKAFPVKTYRNNKTYAYHAAIVFKVKKDRELNHNNGIRKIDNNFN